MKTPFTEAELTALRDGRTAEEYRLHLIRKWKDWCSRAERRIGRLTPDELEEIKRFIETTDIDVISDEIPAIVETHWPWLLESCRLAWPTEGKCSRKMGDKLETCPNCHGALIEIEYYGERLVGCIECNRWTRDQSLFMSLPEEDLQALRTRVGQR
jgi:hypothetical protein